MQSTNTVEGADLTLSWKEDGLTHTLTGKVKARLNYEEDEEYCHAFQVEQRYTLEFIPNKGGVVARTMSEKDLPQTRVITITVPALTKNNIEKATRQAGVGNEEEFMVDHKDTGEVQLTWVVEDE